MAEIRNRATLDSTQFQAGLKNMQGGVQNLGSSLKAIPGIGAALSIAGIAALARDAMKTADEIDNLSRQTGLGVETVQAYQIALDEAGLSMGNLQGALDRMKRAQAEAITGNVKATDTFRRLGISQQELARMNTEQLLERVSKNMGELDGDADATAATFDLMGRNAGRLTDVLIQMNRDGIQAQIDNLKELGLLWDTEVISRLDRAQIRMERFGKQASATSATAFSGLIERMEFIGALVGGASMEEAYNISQAPVVQAQAARSDAEARSLERQMRAAESQAGDRLADLQEQRRLQSLANDELRRELNLKLEIANAELEAAQNNIERYNALREVFDIEQQIARIKEDRQTEEREETRPDIDAGQLRRIGANMPLFGGISPQNNMTETMRRQLAAAEKSRQVLEQIERNMNQGATL